MRDRNSPELSEVGDVGTPNGLRPARLKVGIISGGRVGTALGMALERADHVVVACSAISAASRRLTERRLPDTPVLAPLTDQGCLPLAIHPAMTFTGSDEDVERLADTCFGVTAADETGYAIAQSLVLEIGGEPFRVREDARTLYHAALAHGSNHIVTLIADAVEALRAALSGQELLGQESVLDAPGGLAERILAPLARAALENTLQRGQSALTGPVARGDAAAVAAHLAALEDVDPQLAGAYRADSLRTAQRAHAPEEVFAVLDDWSHPAGPQL